MAGAPLLSPACAQTTRDVSCGAQTTRRQSVAAQPSHSMGSEVILVGSSSESSAASEQLELQGQDAEHALQISPSLSSGKPWQDGVVSRAAVKARAVTPVNARPWTACPGSTMSLTSSSPSRRPASKDLRLPECTADSRDHSPASSPSPPPLRQRLGAQLRAIQQGGSLAPCFGAPTTFILDERGRQGAVSS